MSSLWSQLTSPVYMTLYDETDARDAVSGLKLRPAGTSGTIVVSSLAKDIRSQLQVSHNYTCTLSIGAINDTFSLGALAPGTRVSRYFLDVAPPPIVTIGMTQTVLEDFTSYDVGQRLVFVNNRTGVPNAPHWDGDQINAIFSNVAADTEVLLIDGVRSLALYTNGFARLWYHHPVMNQLTRQNRTQLYVKMSVWPTSRAMSTGQLRMYLVDRWDPVNNPHVGGPGVAGWEVLFSHNNVRVTPFAAGNFDIAGRVTGFYPSRDGQANVLIEMLYDFGSNLMSIAVDGTVYMFTASLATPITHNSIGAIGMLAHQTYDIDYIDVRSQ